MLDIEIKYDTPFEVNKKQYDQIMQLCGGAMCGRVEDDKYFIKVWIMSFVPAVKRQLKKYA